MNRRFGRAVRPLLGLWVLAVAAFWAVSALTSGGIRAGSFAVDYRSFLGATRAFFAVGPGAGYDLAAASVALQHAFGPGAAVPLAAPAPYPPMFFLLLAPFSAASPLLGFLLWTALNLALSLLVLRNLLAQPKTAAGNGEVTILGRRRRAGIILGLLFFPLTLSLYAGQPSGVLLYGLYCGYHALKAGDDGRAGLWLGVLLVKPQYALGLVLVLLLHRRWRALGGGAAVGAVIAGGSLLLAGWDGMLAYKAMLSAVAGFRSAPDGIVPAIMLSWRGLLVNLLPGVPDATGERLTLLLSAVTLALLPFIWRGRWDPRAARFDERFLATVAATLLASYHSHIYGATLLLVPGAALLAQRRGGALLQGLLWLELLVPAPLFVLGRSLTPVAVFYACCLLATVGAALAREMAWAVPTRRRLASVGVRLAVEEALSPALSPNPGGEERPRQEGGIVERRMASGSPGASVVQCSPRRPRVP